MRLSGGRGQAEPRTTISGVTVGFQFEHEVGFEPERAREILRGIPELPGVFALFGHAEGDQPYVTRTANLRRRVARLVDPPERSGADGSPVLSKRLNLRERVGRIAWCVTGSEFESLLVLYHATAGIFGYAEARRRLKLRTPYFLRLTMEHAHPRVYVTNRLSSGKNGRGLGETYGPFPSRLAAERYCDGVLDLFKLRRCWEDLQVSPEHPGCAYGEMKRCMEPCKMACTSEEYAAEARGVQVFFETRGESMLAGLGAERERASEEMDFERAAELHRQYEKVKAAAGQADELVRAVPQLRAVIVQAAGRDTVREERHAEEAAVFLLERGCLAGPERLSTLGVRAVREQTSVGSSLFAQPLMLQAIPLRPDAGGAAEETAEGHGQAGLGAVEAPEDRVRRVLGVLEGRAGEGSDVAMLSDHLSLLRRWYYRPEKQRAGEVFLPNADGSWPVRRILRGAARMVIGEPKAVQETDREGAKVMRTKVLHEGRPDVERVVPVVEKAATFRSRRSKKAAAEGEKGASSPLSPV
ncbi:MAG: hypothetical protein NVSMB3_12380 [Acidobacteriaceae bacterium]